MAVPQIIIYASNQFHALYLFYVFLDELTDFLAVVWVYHGLFSCCHPTPIHLVHQIIEWTNPYIYPAAIVLRLHASQLHDSPLSDCVPPIP